MTFVCKQVFIILLYKANINGLRFRAIYYRNLSKMEKRSLTTGDEHRSADYGPGSLGRAAAALMSDSSDSV